MAEIQGQERVHRSAARQRAMGTKMPRRERPAMVHTTQWQRYVDRVRRLVRLSLHP